MAACSMSSDLYSWLGPLVSAGGTIYRAPCCLRGRWKRASSNLAVGRSEQVVYLTCYAEDRSADSEEPVLALVCPLTFGPCDRGERARCLRSPTRWEVGVVEMAPSCQ